MQNSAFQALKCGAEVIWVRGSDSHVESQTGEGGWEKDKRLGQGADEMGKPSKRAHCDKRLAHYTCPQDFRSELQAFEFCYVSFLSHPFDLLELTGEATLIYLHHPELNIEYFTIVNTKFCSAMHSMPLYAKTYR